MRELIVISGLIFLGYLAEGSVRYVMSESCRIYVEQTHGAPSEQITEDARAALEAESQPKHAYAEVTAASTFESPKIRRF